MDRRRVMLIVAVVVAVFGAGLVFVYVRGADGRAEERFVTVQRLEATVQINPGESIADALAANKVAPVTIASDAALPTSLESADALSGQVALTTIYPGEQIIAQKFGATAADAGPITTLLLPRVTVLGVGSSTPVSTTTTDETGAQTTEQLPRTLMTLALDQKDAERVIFAASNGELAFALLTEKSTVAPGDPVSAADLLTTSS